MQKIKYSWLIIFLLIAILLVSYESLQLGSGQVSILHALQDIFKNTSSLDYRVVIQIRLPRILLAVLIGASLGLSGAAMQGFLRNPLADPGILGVSGGAALGAVLVLYFSTTTLAWFVLPGAAIAGALLSLISVYLLAGRNASLFALILAGLAVNAITGALVSVALNFAPSYFALQEIVFWLMGSLANRNLNHVMIAVPFIVVGWLCIFSCQRFLNALTLGDQTAQTLGFNMAQEKFLLLVGIALCVGASVAVSGSIGFVGLVIPHLLRPLVGHQPGRLLLVSALAGALLLVSADLFVRWLDVARELKLGVLTALLGAPFFLVLIIKSRSRWI